MAPQSKPGSRPASLSSSDTSDLSMDATHAQLSSPDGVETDVSTAALDRGMLMAASTPPVSAAFPAGSGNDGTDADITLRVKAGDQSSSDCRVQKYRQPIVRGKYRMA